MAELRTWKSGKDNPPGMYKVKGKGARYWTGTKWRLSKPTAYHKAGDALQKALTTRNPTKAQTIAKSKPAKRGMSNIPPAEGPQNNHNHGKPGTGKVERKTPPKTPPTPQTTAADKPNPLPKKQTTQEVKKAGNDPMMVWAKANAKMIEKSGTKKQKELLRRYKKHGLKKASSSLKVNAKNDMDKYSGVTRGDYGNAGR